MASNRHTREIIYKTEEYATSLYNWGLEFGHYGRHRGGSLHNIVFSLKYTELSPGLEHFREMNEGHPGLEEAENWICKGRNRDMLGGGQCNCHGCQYLDSVPLDIAVEILSKINAVCRAFTEDQKISRERSGKPLSLRPYLDDQERERRRAWPPLPRRRAATNPWRPEPEPKREPKPEPEPVKMKTCEKVDCGVCMAEPNGVEVTLPCTHKFCLKCVEKWWESSYNTKNCPVCRKEVSYGDAKEVISFSKTYSKFFN